MHFGDCNISMEFYDVANPMASEPVLKDHHPAIHIFPVYSYHGYS